MECAIVGIDYNEPDTSTYFGVTVKTGQVTERFNTGNPQEDYYNATRFACKDIFSDQVMFSSSVDSFIMDGDFDEFLPYMPPPKEIKLSSESFTVLVKAARLASDAGLILESEVNDTFNLGFTIFPDRNDTMKEYGWVIGKGN